MDEPVSADTEPIRPDVELNGMFFGVYEPSETVDPRRSREAVAVDLIPENLELILDSSSSLLPFHFLRTGDRLGRAVVKLLRSDGAAGTGFLVAPGILLTNHHVLPDPESATLAIALANYEAAPPATSPGRPASVSLDPESLFVTNAELDFTFCGVRGLDFLGSITLDRNSQNIATSEVVNIIQHPRGRTKEVALRDNRVIKADNLVVHYACSTEPGSSGSPVFNNQWDVVALHHASVQSKGPEARSTDEASSSEATPRYLNEGIRISAIAVWLETEEANAPEFQDQAARLRKIFVGLDPGVGFFGALGRRTYGRSAPEVVVDSYRDDTSDLDLAYWNVRGVEWGSRSQIADVAQVVADMGMDLWCLVHADLSSATSLREYLGTYLGLEYEFFHEPAGIQPALTLLHKRNKTLAVDRRGWMVELPAGTTSPPLITIRTTTKQSGTVTFHLVVGRSNLSDASKTADAELIRQVIRQDSSESNWILVGESPGLFAHEKLHVLADCNRDLFAATADRDGGLALLTGPGSKVARIFVSPNLTPVFGSIDTLQVTQDRVMPALLRVIGGAQPIAVRLSLDEDPRSTLAPNPVANFSSGVVESPLSLPITDDELGRRIKDMLTPILAKLIEEMRPRPVTPG